MKLGQERVLTMSINKITRDDINNFGASVRRGATINTLDLYQSIATRSAIYPGQRTPLGLMYVSLKMNGEAGEFAEHVGKAMRDDDLIKHIGTHTYEDGKSLTPERKSLLIKEIGDVLWYLSAACNELGISLSDAATVNLEKLCDRSERDALRGSGDNR